MSIVFQTSDLVNGDVFQAVAKFCDCLTRDSQPPFHPTALKLKLQAMAEEDRGKLQQPSFLVQLIWDAYLEALRRHEQVNPKGPLPKAIVCSFAPHDQSVSLRWFTSDGTGVSLSIFLNQNGSTPPLATLAIQGVRLKRALKYATSAGLASPTQAVVGPGRKAKRLMQTRVNLGELLDFLQQQKQKNR